MNGFWLTKDVWLPGSWVDDEPIGMSTREWMAIAKGSALTSEDLRVIVSEHRNFGIVRDEIVEEDPDYPIWIIHIGKNLYGMRIAGFEYRHIAWEDYPSGALDRMRQWHDMLLVCRVRPDGEVPENPW